MEDSRRKAIAFICGMHYADRNYSILFDYTRGSYFFLDHDVNGPNINVFDYERKCYISGPFSSMFDYGVSGYVDFHVSRAGVIDVYDYKTSTSFQATVKGNDVSLYDYKAGKYFEYQLS